MLILLNITLSVFKAKTRLTQYGHRFSCRLEASSQLSHRLVNRFLMDGSCQVGGFFAPFCVSEADPCSQEGKFLAFALTRG